MTEQPTLVSLLQTKFENFIKQQKKRFISIKVCIKKKFRLRKMV